MKYLNVAEKNDAAKTISGLLSNGSAHRREGYSVYNKIYEFEATVNGRQSKMIMTSVSGHLLNYSFPTMYRSWRSIDPQTLFDAPVQKVCPEDYQPIRRTLEREIRGCQGLIIWTDCDREGENIGFEIIEVCRAINSRIAVYRATFSEITSASVKRALQQLTEPDSKQSAAVDVRSELDLRTGAVITRYQTMRLQRLFPQAIANKLISYGSCQIPTLGFVVQRYKEVEAFVEEPFWKLKVTHTIEDLTVEFQWARNRLFDKGSCEDYLLLCLSDPKATVQSIKVKPKNKWRPQPMDTVEMEKLGSRKLKLSAKETMTIAEKLYTRGIISYPRTETNQFSKEINLRGLVEQQLAHPQWGSFAQRVIEWGPNPRNGNKSDQAHPPIHPTKLVCDLGGNDARVYELICRHFLACVSKDAIGSETIVDIDVAGEKFSATGLCIYERNYLDVYVYDKWNTKQIHKYEERQVFEPTDIIMHEGATSAPPLLTEADLIALMDKHGIGTDATHAEHINTIKERGYIGVTETGGFLVPGIIGMGLYEGYDAMELALSKPNLRAAFEGDLKLICQGQKDPHAVLREQIQKYKAAYTQILNKIQALDHKFGQRINETPAHATEGTNENCSNGETFAQQLFQCPKCGAAPLMLKQTKNKTSHYIGCLSYPQCKNVIWLPPECTEPSVLSETCVDCGQVLLKLRLTTAYYKTLFQARTGWYKTCLHCDRKFREAFNINLDTVKRSGSIVADTISGAPKSTRPLSPASATGPGRSGNSGGAAKKRPATTRKPHESSNIRPYCTAAATSTRSSTNAREIYTLLQDDDFDAAILAAETQLNTNSTAIQLRADADLAAVFAEDDDLFADVSWGTLPGQPQPPPSPPPSSTGRLLPMSSALNNAGWDKVSWDTSSGIVEKHARLAANAGSGAGCNASSQLCCNICSVSAKQFTVKRDGPNKGRIFYVCSKPKPCKFFQWADDVSVPSAPRRQAAFAMTRDYNSMPIDCSCGNRANKRTVLKEGPNKDRLFYTCGGTGGRTCNFFKWVDDTNLVNDVASTSRSTAARPSSHEKGNTQREPGVRKCGLCRQPGHTKTKCPRKDEFRY